MLMIRNTLDQLERDDDQRDDSGGGDKRAAGGVGGAGDERQQCSELRGDDAAAAERLAGSGCWVGGVAGSATSANSVFTVSGAGAQIYGNADAFHLVYQPLSGDGTIVARVVSLQGGSS